ncbi:hypothetical protein B7494_g219 [Chlorociboria aeruginascens]|nr:hypothetical protein B7494_g219 [Chlorociboria aeruginascens]
MPLRSTFSPFGSFFQRSHRYYSHSQWHTRFFHASATRRESPNHYKTLQVAFDASPAEIKKSFYILSKTYHPDRNPSDPQASQRFIEISEAYSVLGITAKRQQYDREFLTSPSSPPSSRPQGSYSSSGPVGGRPASGLRKRRTQFHGPPPSFYRSGGWGTHSAKRRAAQENGAPGAEAPNMGEEGGAF